MANVDKKQGKGLDTYYAKLIAEVQNGDVSFETGKGTGTSVKLNLPLVISQELVLIFWNENTGECEWIKKRY